MVRKSKQRTFVLNGEKVKVVSRRGSRGNKPYGYRVVINDNKSVFVNTDNRAEAESTVLAKFNLQEPKKAKAKKVKVRSSKATKKSLQAEAIHEALSDNKSKFILMTDERNSSWLTEEQLKERLFRFIKDKIDSRSEIGVDDLIILNGANGDKFYLTLS